MATRTDAITAAYARVSRSVRLTVLLAERLDRGWARRSVADDRVAMARRQIARGVEDAIEGTADGERAERLTEALADRLDLLDVETEIGDRPAEEIIRESAATWDWTRSGWRFVHPRGTRWGKRQGRLSPMVRLRSPVAAGSGSLSRRRAGRTPDPKPWVCFPSRRDEISEVKCSIKWANFDG